MRRLQQEVTKIGQGRRMIPEEDLDKMQYLKAVIKESLRLHPSLSLLPRESTQDVKLMGYDISSGTQRNIGRPERFLNKFNDYKAHTFEWIPFGAGRRGCPGIQFSVVVLELALANIVYKFDLALPNGVHCEDLDMTEKFGITLHRNSSLMYKHTQHLADFLTRNIMTIFSSFQTFLPLLFSFIVLMIFIRTTWSSFNSKTKKNFPPSPRKLPIIGNFHQLGLSPNHSLRTLSQKHGPVMLLHFGSVPTLVASSAEVAREIMKTHDLSFCSRPNLSIPNILLYGSKDIVFSPYGEYWRQLKSIVMVHLLNNTQVKSFRQVREEEISSMMAMLGETSGSLVNMGSSLTSLTNNIICRVTVGRTYDGKLTDLWTRFANMFTVLSVGNYIPWLSWIDWLSGLEGRAKKLAKEVDTFLESVIEENINKKSEMGVDLRNHEGQNLVEIMLNVQRDNTSGFTLQRDTLKCVILTK
ncbi:hypothetical protein OSB04_005043 [Centaurea solstitialis]|uniref:Cytochrome P450 n=1 Tax=Centaurea solstitialis TaxID=347529 RepID=A0AA38TZW3_9ASTR|nr:hypothetical protein OSB04_005043 [Centaurea solstitialis]